MAPFLRPALTTLDSHSDEAARRVCALFRADAADAGGEDAPALVELPRELVLRDS